MCSVETEQRQSRERADWSEDGAGSEGGQNKDRTQQVQSRKERGKSKTENSRE